MFHCCKDNHKTEKAFPVIHTEKLCDNTPAVACRYQVNPARQTPETGRLFGMIIPHAHDVAVKQVKRSVTQQP